MDYALAMDLKGAGFPNIGNVQHRQGRTFITPDGNESVYSLGEPAPTDNWFVPTLSELIEACGKDFDALYSRHSSISVYHPEKWRADATNRTGLSVLGTSPEEAVARLWLVLHPINEAHEGKS